MKRGYLTVVLLAVAAASLVLVIETSAQTSLTPVNQATSAPFRDGLYVGKLAVERNEAPHVSIGRWSTNAAREAFAAGYRLSYEENLRQQAQKTPEATSATFRDGLFQGTLDANRGRDAHLTVDRWSGSADRALFAAGYQKAYEEGIAARSPDHRIFRQALLVR